MDASPPLAAYAPPCSPLWRSPGAPPPPPPRDGYDCFVQYVEPAVMAALSPIGTQPRRRRPAAAGGEEALRPCYAEALGADAAPPEPQPGERTVRRSAAARAASQPRSRTSAPEAARPGFTAAVVSAINTTDKARAHEPTRPTQLRATAARAAR
jgi:hypothetical protein